MCIIPATVRGVVDGAAAILLASPAYADAHGLKPRARIVAYANVGDCPTLMLNGSVPAARRVLAKARLTVDDIDLWEINEAFSVVAEKFIRDLKLDREKVNVNGGAMASGTAAKTYATIPTERIGDVFVIRLNDDRTLNAASLTTAEELLDAFADAAASARAIVLTGEGRGFCSGANLGGGLDPSTPAYDAGAAPQTHYNPLMLAIRNLPVPLVTAINGAAGGIGCAIALAGDIVIASEQAYFLQAFRRIGLCPMADRRSC